MINLNQIFFIIILNIFTFLNTDFVSASQIIPCKQIKLIVPWGAGGGTDIIMRKIVSRAQKMGLPQLQVFNVGGQGGNKGTKQVAKSKPDGCTLIALHQSAMTSYFTGRIDFTWDAFEPVSMMTSTPSIIGANVNTPYNNLTELIEKAKESPGTITAGGTFGSTSQFVFLLLEDATGIKFKHVSYDGTKQRMTALLADKIKLGEINLAAAIKFIKAGKLKALGVTNDARLDQIPDIKTAEEQGANVIFAVDRGIFAPKGTSKKIVEYYSKIFGDVVLDHGIKDEFKRKGVLIKYKSANEYKNYLLLNYKNMERVAIKLGVYRRNDKEIKLAKINKNFKPFSNSSEINSRTLNTPSSSLFSNQLIAERKKSEKLERELTKLKNKQKQKKLIVKTDKEKPIINAITKQEGSNVVISGRVTDDTGVSEVLVDGQVQKLKSNGTFKTNFYVPRTGKIVEILAYDAKGNKASKFLKLERSNIQQASGPSFDALNPSVKRVKSNPNALALIIGISDYSKTKANALYADKDAQQFYDYATMKLGIPARNVKELVNNKADRVEIGLAIQDWIARSTKQGKTDIYIFFAGHGLASQDGKDMFLLPYDGSPRLLKASAIRRKELFKDIKQANPRSVTVFLDTCYSGVTRNEEMLIAGRPIVIRAKEQAIPDGFTLFSAASNEQISRPLEEAKHGMFSYFLMKGMEGDADANNDNKITARELHAYVEQNVVQQSSGSQTPELEGDKDRILINFDK